jgi:ribonucleoside-diphosphate reductase alpha chain
MYYLRTKAASEAIKFTVQKQAGSQLEPVVAKVNISKEEAEAQMACSLDNPDACEACSG